MGYGVVIGVPLLAFGVDREFVTWMSFVVGYFAIIRKKIVLLPHFETVQ